MPLDKDALEQLHLIRDEVIKPALEDFKSGVDAILKPISEKQTWQDQRMALAEQNIAYLKSKWAQLLTGFTIWSTILGLVIAYAKTKIQQWIWKH
jgi:hypothetical protein